MIWTALKHSQRYQSIHWMQIRKCQLPNPFKCKQTMLWRQRRNIKLKWSPAAHTHTHTRLTTLCPGLPRSAGTRKVKPIWILLKQETMSGWAICKSALCSKDSHASTPPLSFLQAGCPSCHPTKMPFLPPNQHRESTEGSIRHNKRSEAKMCCAMLTAFVGI